MLLKTKVLFLKADEYMCVLLYYALDVRVEKSTRDWATRFPCTNVAQVALIPCSLTWDQAQFERFSYILSNGYRWNFRLARRNVIFKAKRK